MDRIIYIVNGNPRAPYNAEKNCNTPEHDLRLALPKVPSPRLLYILYITNGVRQKKIPAQSGGGRRRNAYARTKGDPKRVLLSNGEDRAAKWVASKKMKKKNFFGKIFSEKTFFAGLGNAVPGLGNAVPGLGNAVPGLGKLKWPSKRTDFL